jgi:hypothetical protein
MLFSYLNFCCEFNYNYIRYPASSQQWNQISGCGILGNLSIGSQRSFAYRRVLRRCEIDPKQMTFT